MFIGKERECFFDNYLIDTDKTTAEFRMHQPIPREVVLTHDEPWEGDGCDFHNFFFDPDYKGFSGENVNGTYRMYYTSWQSPNGAVDSAPDHGILICYAESPDGLHFTKPNLGISEFNGTKNNNIILGYEEETSFDNFYVFHDDNPNCPPNERYKGIASYQDKEKTLPYVLYCYPSEDGIHFKRGSLISEKGAFDTLNIIIWDKKKQLYRGYVRGYHNVPPNGDRNKGIRDIRYIESKDFIHWSDPVLLDFGDKEDYPLYTSVVSPYLRAPQMLIGFPSRYMEKPDWNENFEEMPGKEKRKERISVRRRYGLTITDCIFMVSHDGKTFSRYDEAFMTPGPENGRNWVYGDCYPAVGFVITPSEFKGASSELSMYLPRNHWMNIPAELQRYSLRLDGFVSLHAGYDKIKTIQTKPFEFNGSELFANFSTSARGFIRFSLHCDGTEICSSETFGDSTDRRIYFAKDLAKSRELVQNLSGKNVVLTVELRDADLYSIRFA